MKPLASVRKVSIRQLKQRHSLQQKLTETNDELNQTRRFLSDLIENSGMLMFIKDNDGSYLFVNRKWEEVTGLSRKIVIGKTDTDLFPPAAASQFRQNDLRVLEKGILEELEESIERADGTHYYLSNKFPIFDPTGAISGICGISTDITSRKKNEEALRLSQERITLAMAATNDGLWDWNLKENWVFFDPRYYTMAGYEPNEFPHNFEEWAKRVHPDDLLHCKNALDEHFAGKIDTFDMEFRFQRKDGGWMWILGRGRRVEEDENGKVTRMVGTHIDITEMKKQQQQIEYLSFHDHLTGLYNRRFFDEELKRLDTVRNLPLSLLFFDVNGLKMTNDAFGHPAGDRLLQKVAEVLRHKCREDEIIARVGGDEFVILLPHTDENNAIRISQRIGAALAAEELETGSISASFGWATKTRHEDCTKELFRNAENKMYQHKIYDQASARSESVTFIMKTLHEKIPREQQHSERVSYLCGRIAAEMGLKAEEIKELITAGKLHDIGKIAISNDILNKAGPLTEAEWTEIRRHPEVSFSILSSVNDYAALALIALAHQERYDGKGYPKGLAGKDIPLPARIIAIADAYDAMTCGRPYRQGITPAEAAREIQNWAGTQFDPEIVQVFVALIESGTEDSLLL